MLRTIFILIALVISVLFLPFWVQFGLFFVAVWVSPYRLPLLAPALFADVLYSPAAILSINSLLITLMVAVLILIRWLLLTQTRFANLLYGVEA